MTKKAVFNEWRSAENHDAQALTIRVYDEEGEYFQFFEVLVSGPALFGVKDDVTTNQIIQSTFDAALTEIAQLIHLGFVPLAERRRAYSIDIDAGSALRHACEWPDQPMGPEPVPLPTRQSG